MTAVFQALVPGWRGAAALPHAFPAHVRWALRVSLGVVVVLSLVFYGRPFRMLTSPQRERLLDRMSHHPRALFRALVQWWKLVAMVTDARR